MIEYIALGLASFAVIVAICAGSKNLPDSYEKKLKLLEEKFDRDFNFLASYSDSRTMENHNKNFKLMMQLTRLINHLNLEYIEEKSETKEAHFVKEGEEVILSLQLGE